MRIRIVLSSLMCVIAVWAAGERPSATSVASPAWETELVADANALEASLAFSGGQPALAYHHTAQRNALLFSMKSNVWAHETVTSGTASIRTPRMVMGQAGPYVCFGQSGLKVASRTTAGWTIELIDKAGDECGAIALDGMGNPTVAYSTGKFRDLKIAQRGTTSWGITTVKSKAGVDNSNISLAFDPAGSPHIAYTVQPTLYLAKRDGAVWTTSSVFTGQTLFGSPALAFGAGGEAWLAFTGDNNAASSSQYTSKPLIAGLRAASANTWSFEDVVAEATVGPSLAIDPGGQPAIAYRAPGSVELRFARRDGSAWQTEHVAWPRSGSAKVGRPSLAFDGDAAAIGWVDILSGSSSVNLSRHILHPSN